jgi:antitoxin (DNA-binding transcriptional repressor) of toxin-antitoxin stability system
MKSIPVREAQSQLPQLIAEACRGEVIVLTDGDKQVTLEPGAPLDLEMDTPELEAELLKAANGPFTPLREGELRGIADRALREHDAKRHG